VPGDAGVEVVYKVGIVCRVLLMKGLYLNKLCPLSGRTECAPWYTRGVECATFSRSESYLVEEPPLGGRST